MAVIRETTQERPTASWPPALPAVTATIGTYRLSDELWAVRVSEGTTHTVVAYANTRDEASTLAVHLRRWLGVSQ